MSKPTVVEARFRIVTPLFLGGADPTRPVDHIRPPSVKGALRFWWRALNWSPIRLAANDNEEALKKLHKEEARLFGAAARTERGRTLGGQGCFLLRVSNTPLDGVAAGPGEMLYEKSDGARYIGYGLMEPTDNNGEGIHKGQLKRAYLKPNQRFNVTLAFRGEPDNSVINALKCLGLLGGLGGRVRRGYGSLSLESININDEKMPWLLPSSIPDYVSAVQDVLPGALADHLPPFTAFSGKTTIYKLVMDTSPDKVLNRLGQALKLYQETYLSNPKRSFNTKRAMFGLPRLYGKGKDFTVTGDKSGRRASPLLFHIHPLGQRFIGIASFLPAGFLQPKESELLVGGRKTSFNVDWNIITNFLDGKTDKPGENRFPERQVLWP